VSVGPYPVVVTRLRFWPSSKVLFDTSSVVPLRSSSCLLPDPVNSRPFPSAFTTLLFEQSRRRWFGTYSCKPVPRGRPSSVEQLCTSSAFRLFAVLVAHCNRVSVDVNHNEQSRSRSACDSGFLDRYA